VGGGGGPPRDKDTRVQRDLGHFGSRVMALLSGRVAGIDTFAHMVLHLWIGSNFDAG